MPVKRIRNGQYIINNARVILYYIILSSSRARGTGTKVADHRQNVRGTGVFGGARRVRTVRPRSAALDETAVPVRGRPEPGLLLAARRRLCAVHQVAATVRRERIIALNIVPNRCARPFNAIYCHSIGLLQSFVSVNLHVFENVIFFIFYFFCLTHYIIKP